MYETVKHVQKSGWAVYDKAGRIQTSSRYLWDPVLKLRELCYWSNKLFVCGSQEVELSTEEIGLQNLTRTRGDYKITISRYPLRTWWHTEAYLIHTVGIGSSNKGRPGEPDPVFLIV